jgi:RNA polymerase sigma-70 factor
VKQRNVMRLHYCDDLTLAQIGRLHSVHESTVSRWLLASRDELLAKTRSELCARLRVAQADVDSLMAQLLSRADLSIRTLFADAPP